MFNVAVVSLKQLLKLIAKLIIAVIIIAMIFCIAKKNISLSFSENIDIAYVNIISSSTALAKTYEENSVNSANILTSELVLFNQIQTDSEEVVEETNTEVTESETLEENDLDLVEETLTGEVVEESTEAVEQIYTEVISENNKSDVYTDVYGSVKIKNESSYELTEEMLTPNVDFNNKQDILIFHTHTCESYTPTESNSYEASGNYRTIDLNYSVAHVGDVLTDYLSGFGYNVTHNKTYHDYPAYNGSYTRSYQTVSSLLSGDAWTELVIDLHRDAIRKQ